MSSLDLQGLVESFGYVAAALAILIETLGIPFPGETALLVISAYAAQGHLDIRLVIVTGALGTILGANFGYAIGRRGGRPFLERFSRTLRIQQGYLARTEMFFGRFGGATILFARFVAGLRQWSAVLAGVARMPIVRFEVFTIVGSLTWTIVVCLCGFYLGQNLGLLEQVFREVGYAGALAVTGGALVALVIWRRHTRATHTGR